jgi:hypothetical protein
MAKKAGLVTRAKAAQVLAASRVTVEREAAKGRLQPAATGPRGAHLYRRRDVERLAQARAQSKPPRTVGEARAALLEVQRELAELKLRVARGELIDAKAEAKADFERARTVRDSVLNIPDRVMADLAAETDATRVHARLTDEIRKTLAALADLFVQEDAARA